MNIRRVLIVVGIALAITVTAWFLSRRPEVPDRDYNIVIASLVEIEPIAQLREGFLERVSQTDLRSASVIQRNAQGDNSLVVQIADEIARTRPDLVYVLGTPLAEAIQAKAPSVIIVQGAVTDPVEAGLADSWQRSGRRYAATSDRPPLERIVEIIRKGFPSRTRLGVIYSPGESNSVAVVRDLRRLAAANGLELREFAVGAATDLPAAAASAARTTDIIFVPPDNLVTAGLGTVIRASNQAGVPTVATTADALSQGATIAVANDFRELGRQSADLAVEILLEGRDPANLPIVVPSEASILINSSQAKRFDIPASVLTGPGVTQVN